MLGNTAQLSVPYQRQLLSKPQLWGNVEEDGCKKLATEWDGGKKNGTFTRAPMTGDLFISDKYC